MPSPQQVEEAQKAQKLAMEKLASSKQSKGRGRGKGQKKD